MCDLFPMRLVNYGELNEESRRAVLAEVGTSTLHEGTLIRPAQATMPMGFTWAVALAHEAIASIIKTAYSMIRAPSEEQHNIMLMNRESAPYHLTKLLSIALAIIDDIDITTADWEDERIIALLKQLVRLLNEAGLPVVEDKSLPVGTIEQNELPFIGNIIDLQHKTVCPMKKRIGKLSAFVHNCNFDKKVFKTFWLSLIGNLLSNAMLHHGILSQFNQLFKELPKSKQSKQLNHIPTNQPIHVSKKQTEEVKSIIKLLPFAQVKFDLPIANMFVCFDASHVAVAVKYTYMSDNNALILWNKSMKRKATKDITPLNDIELETIIQKYTWSLAVHHVWEWDKYKKPHINVLEAITANMAIDWTSKKPNQPMCVVILSDSRMVIKIYSKGRSSTVWVLEKVRRFQSVCLVTGIRPQLLHVRSKFNPADQASR